MIKLSTGSSLFSFTSKSLKKRSRGGETRGEAERGGDGDDDVTSTNGY